MNNAISITEQADFSKWLRRAGVLGFWFFFVKGILWLAAPLVFYFFI